MHAGLAKLSDIPPPCFLALLVAISVKNEVTRCSEGLQDKGHMWRCRREQSELSHKWAEP